MTSEPVPERPTPPDDTAERHPLEALIEATCTHERHRWLCLNCAADAMRPEIARLQAENEKLRLQAASAESRNDDLLGIVARIRLMTAAWEQQFPGSIRTVTAASAIREVTEQRGVTS